MIKLSGDPYEGACRAFFVVDPTATGEDWERWSKMVTSDTQCGFDNFVALAQICREALELSPNLSQELRDLFAYSRGYFEAMNGVIYPLWYGQTASTHVPKHYTRRRHELEI